jgi:hypothetical protein
LHDALIQLGSQPDAGSYLYDDWVLKITPQWSVWNAPCPHAQEVSAAELGQPGLWKSVRADGQRRRIFAIPTPILERAMAEERDGINGGTLLEQCTRWVAATASPTLAFDWPSLSSATVESWLPQEQLTVQCGSLLRQGEWICERDQVAIRFPIVPQVPPDLPEARCAWLQALVHEAQDRWHLVRLGYERNEDGTRVMAEVNLTGVPRAIAENLFATSLEALRWVVHWLSEPAEWLADVTVTSDLLAVPPPRNEEPKKGAT